MSWDFINAVAVISAIGLMLAVADFAVSAAFRLFPKLQDKFDKWCACRIEVEFDIPQCEFERFKAEITSTDFRSENPLLTSLTMPGKVYAPDEMRHCRFSSEYTNDIAQAIAMMPQSGCVHQRYAID